MNKPKMFPVKLLRNYAPVDTGEKMIAGSEIELPIEEAKHVINAGIAVRNDPIG